MIFAVGSNYFGQLGTINYRSDQSLPMPLISSNKNKGGNTILSAADMALVTDVQCGDNYTTILLQNGRIYYSGYYLGRIFPDFTMINIPYPLKCTQIACGAKHTIILLEKGLVLSWGVNYYGQLGLGDDENRSSPTVVAALDPRRLGCKVDPFDKLYC